ncbi:MAG: hydrogenase iron-sulfur subunit [Thermodesulfobacteriota bacterium]
MASLQPDDFRIILYLCNWGPHTAFHTLQDSCAALPPSVKMIRIPCSGRISKALLFKPFEMGADGVALVGCDEGTCRYGVGVASAQENVADTREILELLGLGRDRLRLFLSSGENHQGLSEFLSGFAASIETLGKSPVVKPAKKAPTENMSEKLAEIVNAHDVYACQDCGKCTSACSLTLAGKPFSPRAMASAIIAGNVNDPAVTAGVWSCLTCGLCYDRCPSAVNFPEFIRDVRQVLSSRDIPGFESHDGFFRSLSRTMTSPGLPIRHWDWLPESIRTDPQSKVAFFGGCAPYFDVFFGRKLSVDTRKILADSLRLLNFFDIHPALLQAERCCGHDLLWSGDRENFLALARLNAAALAKMGVEELVVSCPEGYRTLSRDYPAQGVPLPCKVTHILDKVDAEISKGNVKFKTFGKPVTFQDPCRLSRHMGLSELPRRLMARIPFPKFTEMADRGAGAICCGNCAWIGCDAFSKALQRKRLSQVRDSGAQVLVTACPKCRIHLSCAMDDPFESNAGSLPIMDIVSVLAETISWK